MTGEAIVVGNLTKSFGSLRALDDVSFTVGEGDFFGLLGPNGAGKTTLISILAGLCRPDSGRAFILGRDAVSDSLSARRHIGVVPQEVIYDPFFTVRESLRFQSRYYGIRKNDEWIEELLATLGLSEKARANTRTLSGGMKRRLMIAQALVHRPPVVVLDEPTAGVDINLRLSLWQFIRRLNNEGHTIVLTTHYLQEAEELCGRIALMKEGRIVALEKTPDLLAKAGKSVRLLIKFADGAPPPEKWRNSVAAARADRTWELCLQGYGQVESLLTDARAEGLAVAEMKVAPPDLEDAFVRIINQS